MEEKKDRKDYKYYAFISYTEADYDMVKWLHHKLEFYHIPTKMRKKYRPVRLKAPIKLPSDSLFSAQSSILPFLR